VLQSKDYTKVALAATTDWREAYAMVKTAQWKSGVYGDSSCSLKRINERQDVRLN
jgi:hypothetical protein